MPTPRERAPELLSATFMSRASLRREGMTGRAITEAVRRGWILRPRRGRYLATTTDAALVDAATLGARLDCVSLLTALGVFVLDDTRLHVQLDHGASRLPVRPSLVVAHWRPRCGARDAVAADLIEALAQSCRCQSPRAAVATLDSAWHHRLIGGDDLAQIFARLPRRFRRLGGLLDRRCESGPESLMRLLLRTLGCRFDVQVPIEGVGRVDFVVDGWLIIECDSKEHHEDWAAQKRDRRRDLAAAALGYTTIRPLAEDIMYRRDTVRRQVAAVLAHPPRR